MTPTLRCLSLLCGLALFNTSDAVAQRWPQQSWWQMSPARLNPAVSANAYSLSATGFLRQQYNNLPGAPNTIGLTVASPIYRVNAGAAIAVERDRIGVQEVTQARASLALAVFKTDKLRVSAGFGASLKASRIDGDLLRTSNGDYGAGNVNHLDVLLPTGSISARTLGLDAGMAVSFGETQIGISALDVNAPSDEYDALVVQWPRTYLAFGTTTLPVNEVLDLQLSAIVQNDTRTTQSQVAAFGWYNGNIGAGAAFRGFGGASVDAASLLLGWRASPVLTFAYAYDIGLSELSDAHDGSHEISVRFELANPIGKGKLPPLIYNPRL